MVTKEVSVVLQQDVKMEEEVVVNVGYGTLKEKGSYPVLSRPSLQKT